MHSTSILAILALRPAHSQQATPTDTPAGRALTEWLAAFNSGDRNRISAFQQRYGVQGPPADVVIQFRTQTGGFDLLKVTKSEPLHIEFVVKERNSATRANGTLDVTASDPPKVTGPMLTALPPDASELLSGDKLKAAHASVPYHNTGDRARIAAFLAKSFPSRTVEQETGFREMTGVLNLRALTEASATSVSGFVEERESDNFAQFNLTIEPHGAQRITNLNLRLVPRPPGFEVPRLGEAALRAGETGCQVVHSSPAAPSPRLKLGEELIRRDHADAARTTLLPVANGAFDTPEQPAAAAMLPEATTEPGS